MTEWNAGGYTQIGSLQEAMAAEVLALLSLRGDERVLDLGCGNGKVTAQIAARVPDGSVVGVDASTEMIGFATEKFSRRNLRFETCDIRQLAYHEEFDVVVSFNALHWIPDQEIALRAIRAAMKPEAMAQLRLVPDGERNSLEMVLEETRKAERWARYYESFRDPYLHLKPEQYSALCERNGLRVTNLHVSDISWDFGSRAGFEAFGAVTFVEWSKRLPQSECQAFVDDVLQRYAEVIGDGHTFRFYQMDVTANRQG
jgi:trans-aconitate 2-methyltransferase